MITPEQIEAKNVEVLLLRLKEGKPLTESQTKLIQSYLTKQQNDSQPAVAWDQSREALAALWQCTPQYVSKLKKAAGGHLPTFATQEDAIQWYNSRKQRRSGKIFQTQRQTSQAPIVIPPPRTESFEETMLRQSESMPLHAFALYEAAVKNGDDSLVGVRIKNWAEAAKQAAAAREQYLDLQERNKKLISVENAIEVLSAPLQELINRISKSGRRIFPEDAALATKVNEDADRTLSIIKDILEQAAGQMRADNASANEAEGETW